MTSKIRFCILFCLIMSLLCGAFAQAVYHENVKINYPDTRINPYNVTYMGAKYYMSKAGGGLYVSDDAKTWSENRSRSDAYVISDLKQKSDSLVIFQGGFVLKSTDGINFKNTMYLGENAVVHYDNGVYVAATWRDDTKKNCYLYFSKDAENWVRVGDSLISNASFTVRPIGTSYLLGVYAFNGLDIGGEVKTALLYPDTSVVFCDYEYVVYSHEMGKYIAFNGSKCAVSSNPKSEEFTLIDTEGADFVSFYKDKFYMTKNGGMYVSADGCSWSETDAIYGYSDNYTDKDNAMIELYFKRDKNGYGSIIARKTYNPAKGWDETEILGSNYEFERYGDALAVMYTGSGSRNHTGFVSNDGLSFYQTDAAYTFLSLNNYAKRGDYIFNPNTDKVVYKAPVPAFEGIEQSGIEVRANGKYIAFDAPPVLMYDRTLVPLRAVCDAMGISVGWDEATKTVICSKNGNILYLTIDSKDVWIKYFDGVDYNTKIDAPATLVDDRTMVPVRILAETFNFTADWDGENQAVIINSK